MKMRMFPITVECEDDLVRIWQNHPGDDPATVVTIPVEQIDYLCDLLSRVRKPLSSEKKEYDESYGPKEEGTAYPDKDEGATGYRRKE